jgi:hypothetical protein
LIPNLAARLSAERQPCSVNQTEPLARDELLASSSDLFTLKALASHR